MKQSCHDGVLKSAVAVLAVKFSGQLHPLVCLRQLQGFLPGSHVAKYTFAPYFSQEIIQAGIPGIMPGTGMSVVCYVTSQEIRSTCVWLYSANNIYLQAPYWLKSTNQISSPRQSKPQCIFLLVLTSCFSICFINRSIFLQHFILFGTRFALLNSIN